MEQSVISTAQKARAAADRPGLLARSLTLMKPITWFGPTWAFLCGAIASGAITWALPDIGRVLLGMAMAGPLLCGLSQVINDYFDREIDAINEPDRLIPSGLVSLRQIMLTILLLGVTGAAIALYLGPGVAVLTGVGLLLAMAYSAPPIRAKRNGWFGNTLVAISYEGLAWMAGHLAFASLTTPSITIALLYSLGAHGIMSINDFKSIVGDRLGGIRTIPVLYGEKRAAWLIVVTMNLAQVGVIGALLAWGNWIAALVITALVVAQLPVQRRFLREPAAMYLKFSAIGVAIFVWGMMVAALGVRAL